MPDPKHEPRKGGPGKAGKAPGKGTGAHAGSRPESKTESARERPTGVKPPKEGKK